ncbi:hypothetical protein SAMN05443549_101746 [Flavobacterium fluvii]|uniref:Uncharacterized protein n=1 Tax=Flavobacterium fluvii TaxID=468056 RepID=A0A1M5FF33_9FLAO|nr:hypothetical protein SAMN05443549_101746 [Flavobacterium fluvii]
MDAIKSISYALKPLKNKITCKTTLQLNELCKLKRGKKLIEVILSIIQKSAIFVQIIDPNLLDLYHYKPIYYSISLLCIILNFYIKHKSRNV